MEYLNIKGNEETIISELAKYMSKGGARLMARSLPFYTSILDKDECYEKSDEAQKDGPGLILSNTNYYINLKMTTIAFIGLLLDIRFTQGFSSFLLNTFGVTAEAVRKLSDLEKCVLLLVKSGAVIAVKEEEYMLAESAVCANYMAECDYRRYDKCNISNELLNKEAKKLKDKGIVEEKAGMLIYCI